MSEVQSEALQRKEELLDQKQLAQELKKSEAWAERRRWDGTGIPFVKVGRTPYYRRADVNAWLASQVRTSTRDTEAQA